MVKEDYTPVALENAPEQYEWMLEYLDAFEHLHRSRSFSEHGPNPISILDMRALIDLIGASDTDEFLDFIRKMDDVYLTLHQESLARKLASEKRSNGQRRK